MNYYEVLQVQPTAEPEVVTWAYKALARKYHPDANGGQVTFQVRMAQLNAAYEVLNDPVRRRLYDEELNRNSKQTYTKPPMKASEQYQKRRRASGYKKQFYLTYSCKDPEYFLVKFPMYRKDFTEQLLSRFSKKDVKWSQRAGAWMIHNDVYYEVSNLSESVLGRRLK